jgi:hypothetical protein
MFLREIPDKGFQLTPDALTFLSLFPPADATGSHPASSPTSWY